MHSPTEFYLWLIHWLLIEKVEKNIETALVYTQFIIFFFPLPRKKKYVSKLVAQ